MKRISIVVLILCARFVSVAWGQQTAGTCVSKSAQFHKYNMRRSNPCEKVLKVNNVGELRLKWSYATAYIHHPIRHGGRPRWRMGWCMSAQRTAKFTPSA
jgi:hypothetical protein